MSTTEASRMSRIAAIVLAAGRSTRMGHFKLLADVGGVPMLRRVVETVQASGVTDTIVVSGHQAEAVAAALQGLDVRLIHNPRFADGLATSLSAGLAALPPDTDGVLVALGDMPQVTTATLDALIAAFTPGAVVVPVSAGEIGNPILWPREAFAEMTRLAGDAGARRLLPAFEGRVRRVEVADGGIFADVDTPEALAQVRSRLEPGA